MSNWANRNPELVKVIPDFLEEDENEFWLSHLRNDEFWRRIDNADHIEGQPYHFTYNNEYWAAHNLNAIYKYLNKRMHKKIEYEFGDDFLYKPSPAFRKWVRGTHMGGHGDGFKQDLLLDFEPVSFGDVELVPRGYLEVATVLYYNDDFEGGKLHFPGIGVEVQPKKGMLVAFPCASGYEHGVTEITAGERLTSATHWIRCTTMSRTLMQHSLPETWWLHYENVELVYEMMGHPTPVKPKDFGRLDPKLHGEQQGGMLNSHE